MTTEILVISISTIASKAAFNTSARVIDPYYISLVPKTVNMFMCEDD